MRRKRRSERPTTTRPSNATLTRCLAAARAWSSPERPPTLRTTLTPAPPPLARAQFPNDDAKEAQFKALSEAYQCLFDDETRAAYDQFGKEGTQASGVDPRDVFAAVFGGPDFEPWVGTLAMCAHENEQLVSAVERAASELATFQAALRARRAELPPLSASELEAKKAEADALNATYLAAREALEAEQARTQAERVRKCVDHLRAYLAPPPPTSAASGSAGAAGAQPSEFATRARADLARLRALNMGEPMLNAIGAGRARVCAAMRGLARGARWGHTRGREGGRGLAVCQPLPLHDSPARALSHAPSGTRRHLAPVPASFLVSPAPAGYVYVHATNKWLASKAPPGTVTRLLGTSLESARELGHNASEALAAVSKVVALASAQSRLARDAEAAEIAAAGAAAPAGGKRLSEEQRAELARRVSENTFHLVWQLTKKDLEETLRAVVEALLSEAEPTEAEAQAAVPLDAAPTPAAEGAAAEPPALAAHMLARARLLVELGGVWQEALTFSQFLNKDQPSRGARAAAALEASLRARGVDTDALRKSASETTQAALRSAHEAGAVAGAAAKEAMARLRLFSGGAAPKEPPKPPAPAAPPPRVTVGPLPQQPRAPTPAAGPETASSEGGGTPALSPLPPPPPAPADGL
jgi:hypothetical protein